jgi:hypothetical protein
MNRQTGQRYWFRARRRGRGWGLPSSTPGWIFFLAWFAVLLLIVRYVMPRHPFRFTLALALWGLVYVLMCFAKGEPMLPRQDHGS